MNLELMIKVLKEKGFSEEFIRKRMTTFAGLKLPTLERVMNGEEHRDKPHNED